MLAQSHDSVPPAPAWISKTQLFLSYSPDKYVSNFNSSSFFIIIFDSSSIISNISSDSSTKFIVSKLSIIFFSSSITGFIILFKLFSSVIVLFACSWLSQKFGWFTSIFNLSSCFCFDSKSKRPPNIS